MVVILLELKNIYLLGKLLVKLFNFFFKYVIISIEFHFKLVSNYFELYEKSNQNYI